MRYVELFCGAGGTSCGFREAGWECVAAIDYSESALRTYAANFPTHTTHCLDLSQPLPDDLVESYRGVDAVAASSPCTDFSTANPRPRDRGTLTSFLGEHVARLSPRWVLFENVPRARASAEYAEFVARLRGLGYVVSDDVIRCMRAGIAQDRRRLILLADREGRAPEAMQRLHARLSATTVSMRQAFAHARLPCPQPFIYLTSCNDKKRKSVYSVDGVAPTVRGNLRPLRPNYPFPPRDDCHDREHIFNSSVEHNAVLQGFPANFVWYGTKTSNALAVGNAVPPPVAERVARAVDDASKDL